jgi:glycerate-2-kinase
MPSRIRVLAVGKASIRMLDGVLTILGRHVVTGILVAPNSATIAGLDRRITPFRTGHPIPDRNGVRASKYVLESIARMNHEDLLLCLISGGASAMLPAPVADVPLTDKRTITRRLIRSKASIHEVNTVRRHLSELKGGRLVENCGAGRVISLIISDVPGNSLSDIGSGLTAPDPTTFEDAVNVLREFDLWDSAPTSVKRHLTRGLLGQIPDTPKPGNPIFRRVRNVIIADNNSACKAMKESMKRRDTTTTILTSSLNVDARSLGKLIASIAQDNEAFNCSARKSKTLVMGGETTVDVKGRGKGGRNQEVALAALDGIAGLKGVAVATLGTDGIDGNSPAAGAIIDGQSAAHAIRLGLHVREFIARNDSYSFFRKLGDSIVTGPTGTNVSDLYLLIQA